MEARFRMVPGMSPVENVMLDFDDLTRAFERIGAACRIASAKRWSIDVRSTRIPKRRGSPRSIETFSLTIPPTAEVRAVDVQPADRHLLLGVRLPNNLRTSYLAGHDERHWFAAAIPDRPASVSDAKRQLMPQVVLDAMTSERLRPDESSRRRTRAFLRHGEWFFVPMGESYAPQTPVRFDESISRARGSPHRVDELARVGSVSMLEVIVDGVRRIVPEESIRRLRHDAIVRLLRSWRVPLFVVVRGRVRHRDHATLDLGRRWHRVVMNREHESPGMSGLRFLD